jgi:hypothetical protein
LWRAGDELLPADDDQILLAVDPIAGNELVEQRPVGVSDEGSVSA